VEFTCPSLPLPAGAYYLGALARDLTTGKTLAWWDGETRLYVDDGAVGAVQMRIPHTWEHTQGDAARPELRASILSKPAG
jgi:hypothetical protein